MTTHCNGIDHIGIVSDDLAGMEARYERMGFCVAPRCELVAVLADGSERPLNQHNSHLVFGNTYVELTAVAGDLEGHHLEQALGRYFGFHIIAMLAENADREHARLSSDGFELDDVAGAGRSIGYPSGKGMGRFRWFRITDRDAPEAFFCYVEHLTPDLVFDPLLNDHPNGAHELHEVVICSDNPQQSADRLARIVDAPWKQTATGLVLAMRQAAIRLIGGDQGQHEYGDTPMPPLPFAAGFSVRTRDLRRTAEYLASTGLAVRQQTDRLSVEPERAGQPLIGFVEG